METLTSSKNQIIFNILAGNFFIVAMACAGDTNNKVVIYLESILFVVILFWLITLAIQYVKKN